MSAVLDPTTAPKVTTMDTLRRGAQAPEANMPVVRMGFGDLQGFELMQRAAKALAASTLVPTTFQNNLPNCLIALEMAQRIGASPLMVMQNLYIVHGRPGWSAKFLIATMNQCGRFSAVRFDWGGERDKDTWSCRAWATEKETQQRIEGPTISIALAKKEGWYEKSGSKWKTIPELMLMYRAAAWMINTHAPEISMGLNTQEELGDVYDATPDASGNYQVTTESLRRVDTGTGEITDATAGATVDEPETAGVSKPEEKANPLDVLMGIVERALALPASDKAVALEHLEGAEFEAQSLPDADKVLALKGIRAAQETVRARVIPPAKGK